MKKGVEVFGILFILVVGIFYLSLPESNVLLSSNNQDFSKEEPAWWKTLFAMICGIGGCTQAEGPTWAISQDAIDPTPRIDRYSGACCTLAEEIVSQVSTEQEQLAACLQLCDDYISCTQDSTLPCFGFVEESQVLCSSLGLNCYAPYPG